MSKVQFRISLKAARINADLKQEDAADKLSYYFGSRISRQRVSYFEANPDAIPPAYGMAFSRIYGIPIDYLNFNHESTLSYTADSA